MGKENEFTDVSMGIGWDIVFTMHGSSFLGRPNDGGNLRAGEIYY